MWSSARCAGVLLVLLLLVDWGSGRLTLWRAALWPALAGLLFVVPGQLLVEATAISRGVDPDAPDGLGKVTLTR